MAAAHFKREIKSKVHSLLQLYWRALYLMENSARPQGEFLTNYPTTSISAAQIYVKYVNLIGPLQIFIMYFDLN